MYDAYLQANVFAWSQPSFAWWCISAEADTMCNQYFRILGIFEKEFKDVSAMASQITSLTIIYSIFHSGADQRKHQSSASMAFVSGSHRWSVNSPHEGPVTRKMFRFDDVIMYKEMFSIRTLTKGTMKIGDAGQLKRIHIKIPKCWIFINIQLPIYQQIDHFYTIWI